MSRHRRFTATNELQVLRLVTLLLVLVVACSGSAQSGEAPRMAARSSPIDATKSVDSRPAPTNPGASAPTLVRLIQTPEEEAQSRERDARSARHDSADLDAQVRSAEAAESQVRINWAALVLSILSAAFLGWTLIETRRSAAAAIRAADAATRSVEIAETGVRPIVVPRIVNAKGIYPPGGIAKAHIPKLNFCWANYGKTPAFLREARFELRLHSELPATRDWVNPTTQVDQTVLPGETNGDDTLATRCSFSHSLTDEEIRIIRTKLTAETQRAGLSARFFFVGSVVYDDVFGNTHETGFCMKLFANGTQAMRGGLAYNYNIVVRSDATKPDLEESE